MHTLLSRDISGMSYDEIKALGLQEYADIEHSRNNSANYMYVSAAEQKVNEDGAYYPMLVYANKHKGTLIDKTLPFRTVRECVTFCETKNKQLGHTTKSMLMVLESIRLEELLRKKLRLERELKIKSDYVIRESAGYKYILFDRGNGIITTVSIIDALNTGMAAIQREKTRSTKKEENKPTSNCNTKHNYAW